MPSVKSAEMKCFIQGLFCLIVFSVTVNHPVFAQQDSPSVQTGYASQAKGVDGEAIYVGDLMENVNVYNGNLTVSIPIGPTMPLGGGYSYRVSLNYNANSWDNIYASCSIKDSNSNGYISFQTTAYIPDYSSNAGMGWEVSFGRLFEPRQPPENTGSNSPWVFESPDGGRIQFGSLPVVNNNRLTNSATGALYSLSDLRARLTDLPGGKKQIELADGTTYTLTNLVSHNGQPNWRTTRIDYGPVELNNWVTIDYDTGQDRWILRDSQSRETRLNFAPVNGTGLREFTQLKSVETPHIGGTHATYQLEHKVQNIQMYKGFSQLINHDGCDHKSSIDEDRLSNENFYGGPLHWSFDEDFLARIRLPDGSFYQMFYYLSDATLIANPGSSTPNGGSGHEGAKSGALKQLRLPTGLRYEWEYKEAYFFGYGRGYLVDDYPNEIPRHRLDANHQSGVVKKQRFEIIENQNNIAIPGSLQDGAPAVPEEGSELHYGTWKYIPAKSGYEAVVDADADGEYVYPCYLSRTVTHPAGLVEVYYFNTVNAFDNGRVGQPYTQCDPFQEVFTLVADESYYGPRKNNQDGTSNAVPTHPVFDYNSNGTGPFLSKAVFEKRTDDIGNSYRHLLRTEWLSTIALSPETQAPKSAHIVTLKRETRYHDGDTIVLAKRSQLYSRYDGFGHYGRIHQSAVIRQGEEGFVSWGEDRSNESYFTIADPDQDAIPNVYFDFSFSNFGALEWGRPAAHGSGTAINLTKSTPWLLDLQHYSKSESGSGGSLSRSISRQCFNEIGLETGSRALKGGGLGPDDLYTTSEYDVYGNLKRQLAFGGDGAGLLSTTVCPQLSIHASALDTHYYYDYGVQYYSEIRDANDDVVSASPQHVVDQNTGQILSTTDINGVEVAYGYDDLGRLKFSQIGNKARTHYTYDMPRISTAGVLQPCQLDQSNQSQSCKLKLAVSTCNPGSQNCPISSAHTWQESTYDARGIAIEQRRRQPDQSIARSKNHYDSTGRLLESSVWHPDGASNYATTEFSYDVFGRTLTTEMPDGSIVVVSHENSGDWMTTRNGRVHLISDQPGGNSSEQDISHVQFHDAWGRLLWSDEAKDTAIQDQTTPSVISTYAYDHADRLIRVCVNDPDYDSSSCAGQLRLFEYDGRGLLIKEAHPEIHAGTTYQAMSSEDQIQYTYDGAGRLQKVNAPGTQFDLSYIYDSAGRLTQIHETHGDNRVLSEFKYAPINNGESLSRYRLYQAKQHQWIRRTLNSNPERVVVTETFQYNDPEGLFTDYIVQTSLGSRFHARVNQYDLLANVESLTHADCLGACAGLPQFTLNYVYDEGALTSIPGFVNQIQYHDDGAVKSIQHAHGVIDEYQKDAQGWRIEQIQSNAIAWQHGPIDYDGVGNIKRIGADVFQYDGLSRLHYGEVTAHTGQQFQQLAAYDDFGNISSLKQGAANLLPEQLSGPAIVADAKTNRLTSGNATYDAAGNITRLTIDNTVMQFTSDPLGRLIRLKDQAETFEYSYLYNTDGNRLAMLNLYEDRIDWTPRSARNTLQRAYWSNLDLTQWGLEKDYVYMGNHQIATIYTDGQTRHFHLDHLGSTRRISESFAGQTSVVTYNDFYPFGGYVLQANNEEDIQYTGHERDVVDPENENTDLDYMRARYYSSRMGRMLAVDPVLGDAGDSQSWNRYIYALNSPINRIDPDGREPVDAVTFLVADITYEYIENPNGKGNAVIGEMKINTARESVAQKAARAAALEGKPVMFNGEAVYADYFIARGKLPNEIDGIPLSSNLKGIIGEGELTSTMRGLFGDTLKDPTVMTQSSIDTPAGKTTRSDIFINQKNAREKIKGAFGLEDLSSVSKFSNVNKLMGKILPGLGIADGVNRIRQGDILGGSATIAGELVPFGGFAQMAGDGLSAAVQSDTFINYMAGL